MEESVDVGRIDTAEHDSGTTPGAEHDSETGSGKGLDPAARIRELFGCKSIDIRTYSPLTLAYIGDAVFDLIIRTMVVEKGNRSAHALHKASVVYVKAPTQAAMIELLMPDLTEEETAVYHRGRNAKSYTTAKNAAVGDYRKATGLEALMGYLYLQGKMDRCMLLVREGINRIGRKQQK